MDYKGRFDVFDPARIKTYPVKTRTNKVKLQNLMSPARIPQIELPRDMAEKIKLVASTVVAHRKEGKPVVFFTGAHLIKNGIGPLLIDLVKRNFITLVAGNGATAIHDFELALIGETSEHVPNALGEGTFGMAREFACINTALTVGNRLKLGYGESLGRMICDKKFRDKVLAKTPVKSATFEHQEVSVLAQCYNSGIPFTIHAGIGVDVIDQHPSFDGSAKGGCSGRDFLIFVNEIMKFGNGGVVINCGSAVQGPEVLLKAVSMVTNAGAPPRKIFTADFDLRDCKPDQSKDESAANYYFRDQKSVVTRVPHSFGGMGIYVKGNQKQTIPALYKAIMKETQKKQ